MLLSGLLIACDRKGTDKLSTEQAILEVWAHAGQAAERETLQQLVTAFNHKDPHIQIRLTFIPERIYNAQVQAAAIAGDLPDVLEFDGPYLYNYAWQGHLIPLEDLLNAELLADLLPSIHAQGTYQGHLFSVGIFDSGLAMYGRRSMLQQVGMEDLPNDPEQSWSITTFNLLLDKLANQDPDGAVLDLKLNYPGEWFTYAFSPLIQSAGGDLIDRDNYQTAQGKLNSRHAVFALQNFQDWLKKGLVDPNVDDAAFLSGRVALSWAGHWEYARYKKAWGDDLVLLPLPDLGQGTRTGQGSWVWGITRYAKNPHLAVKFVEFLLQAENILAMSNSNGAVPATRTAIQRSTLYRDDGPLHLFAVQLAEGYAIPRPQTPVYPVISSAMRHALDDIRNGADVQLALDNAVKLIDQDIHDNKGYPPITAPK